MEFADSDEKEEDDKRTLKMENGANKIKYRGRNLNTFVVPDVCSLVQ